VLCHDEACLPTALYSNAASVPDQNLLSKSFLFAIYRSHYLQIYLIKRHFSQLSVLSPETFLFGTCSGWTSFIATRS